MTYYSMAPIRFGQYVAKYRVEPVQDGDHALRPSLTKPGPAEDALRLLLEETLRQQEVLFNFQVQLRTSEQTMPVEDATVEWPESESPYRTVATFRIFRQDIAPRREAGNNLSFTVWHAIADHRPLGGINRVRREAYRTSSVWRHQEAGKVRKNRTASRRFRNVKARARISADRGDSRLPHVCGRGRARRGRLAEDARSTEAVG